MQSFQLSLLKGMYDYNEQLKCMLMLSLALERGAYREYVFIVKGRREEWARHNNHNARVSRCMQINAFSWKRSIGGALLKEESIGTMLKHAVLKYSAYEALIMNSRISSQNIQMPAYTELKCRGILSGRSQGICECQNTYTEHKHRGRRQVV